jgi:predicted ATP-dependent protease
MIGSGPARRRAQIPMPWHSDKRLDRAQVRLDASLAGSPIRTSGDIPPSTRIVGQSEALEALRTGLGLRSPGFHIYVSGATGTGRFAAVREMIDQVAPVCPVQHSYIYVHDFANPSEPILIMLGRGEGREFSSAADALRLSIRELVPALLNSEKLALGRQRLQERYAAETGRILGGLEARARERGFAVVRAPAGDGAISALDLAPIVGEEPVPLEALGSAPGSFGLSPPEITALAATKRQLMDDLAVVLARHRQVSLRYRRLLDVAEQRRVREALEAPLQAMRQSYGRRAPDVQIWLDRAADEIVQHLAAFKEETLAATGQPGQAGPNLDAFLSMLRANVIFDPGETGEVGGPCPIIEEHFPTYRNLFGAIDSAGEGGPATHAEIRAGSLLRASGGYILLSAHDILSEPRVYEALKRTLRRGLLEIQPREDLPGPQAALKPAPIPLDVKVILVGDESAFAILTAGDPFFSRIFKIKVEFDVVMDRDEPNRDAFLGALRRIQDRDHLPDFAREALEALIEEGVRLAGDRRHLSTNFSVLADVMREAAYRARSRGSSLVHGEDLRTTLDARRRRHGLAERRMLAELRAGTVLLEVDGWRTGQVNGLGFYDLADAEFGLPMRITATTAVGGAGVISIERESDLSGSVHDKGVLILTGLLGSLFARDKPLSLVAHLAFEQSYGVVDGDSACLAELLAILSSIARCALRQDLAVTGSLNQFGDVQPVGGVTEKIQGFFRVCNARGLTGRQGVVLPAKNVCHLQLDEPTAAAIEAGTFHVYAVSSFKEALEIFSERSADDILKVCDEELGRFAEAAARFSGR